MLEQQQRREQNIQTYEDKMLFAFVQKQDKFLFYKFSFEKIRHLQSVWSWWGFFFGFDFLYYRKVIKFPIGQQ